MIDMKRKVLFLTASYPEIRKSATVLCSRRVIDALRRYGSFELHCLTLRYEGERMEESIEGLHIHRINRTLPLRLTDRFPALFKLQKFLSAPFYPCNFPIQLKLWERAAVKLFKKERFDFVLAEHHSYETLMTGCKLKRLFPDVVYLPILWDPVMGQIPTGKLPAWFTSKRILSQEIMLSKYSDKIISTQSMKTFFEKVGDISSEKRLFFDIPGIQRPEAEVSTGYLSLLKPDSINIVYSGLLVIPQRSPEYIIKLLNMTDSAPKINLLFFCSGNADNMLEKLSVTFKGTIAVHGYIPLSELHTLYRRADYLLNISDSNAAMTPSKIFEYMSFGKPVISTYRVPGDAAKTYLEKYPDAFVCDETVPIAENLSAIDAFLKKEHPLISFEKVAGIYPMNTTIPFVELLSNMK